MTVLGLCWASGSCILLRCLPLVGSAHVRRAVRRAQRAQHVRHAQHLQASHLMLILQKWKAHPRDWSRMAHLLETWKLPFRLQCSLRLVLSCRAPLESEALVRWKNPIPCLFDAYGEGGWRHRQCRQRSTWGLHQDPPPIQRSRECCLGWSHSCWCKLPLSLLWQGWCWRHRLLRSSALTAKSKR